MLLLLIIGTQEQCYELPSPATIPPAVAMQIDLLGQHVMSGSSTASFGDEARALAVRWPTSPAALSIAAAVELQDGHYERAAAL